MYMYMYIVGHLIRDCSGCWSTSLKVGSQYGMKMESEHCFVLRQASTSALQSTYPARSICTDLVSKTSRLKSFGRLYSTTSLLATITCHTRAVMHMYKEHMHGPISRCGRQAWLKLQYLWHLWSVQYDSSILRSVFCRFRRICSLY